MKGFLYKGVTRTERGWASHFCCSNRCLFHRSTLLEYNGTAIVVSSVGRLKSLNEEYFVPVARSCRYFETMVFYADNSNKYMDADVKKGELYLGYPDSKDPQDEIGANDLHEEVVEMFVNRLKNGKL